MIPLTPADIALDLRANAVFASMPAESRAVLSEMMDVEEYATGATVCTMGEPADRVFLVHAGRLSVHQPGLSDAVRYRSTHEIVGEYGMFGRGVRNATLRAEEPTVLLTLDYPRFREFLMAFPESMWALLAVAAGRLSE